ncbi:MAG: spore protease YyaC [Lachnospiraceae bacterium]|nr:spore protease YyaC [Lachnospiraceae bacterium]
MDRLKSRFLSVRLSGTAGADVLDPQHLKRILADFPVQSIPPVILCIGTDRIIGDCLGPLVGTMLNKSAGKHLPIYGTLQNTVHALNLPETIVQIKKKHSDRIILAVDASLGAYEHIGGVFVRPGPLHPGAGVCKNLPQIGDISITGIANSKSSQPYLDLQTARLSTISSMADMICGCILEACMN